MKALVTGGGGFLGRAIVEELLTRGDAVRVMGRQQYPDLEARGVECLRGDLGDGRAVEAAVRGVDVIFHVAARAGYWGQYGDFENANVLGTDNIIWYGLAAGVTRLVYTSSPSVVAADHDLEGINEDHPYPRETLCHYQSTKLVAEKRVLAANGADDGPGRVLSTVSLRPHLIFGPGDPHIVPRMLARARQGKLRQVGGGKNRVDVIYVENAARAHILAADRLGPGSPIAGKAYFLSQGQPVELWPFIGKILAGFGAPPVRGAVPYWLAWQMGRLLEFVYRRLALAGEPPMTRFLAVQLGRSHHFDISRARRDLGYEPRISTEEGLRRMFAAGPAPGHGS